MSKEELILILSRYVTKVADNLGIRSEFVIFRELCREIQKDPDFENHISAILIKDTQNVEGNIR